MALSTKWTYYDNNALHESNGWFGEIKSIHQADQTWRAFVHFSSNSGTIGTRYILEPDHRQPSTALPPEDPQTDPTNFVGRLTTFERYPLAFSDGFPTPFGGWPTRKTVSHNQIETSRTTWDYSLITFQDLPAIQTVRKDYSSASSHLSTKTIVFSPWITGENRFLRGKPVLIDNPDGTRQVHIYQRGTFDPLSRQFTPSNGQSDTEPKDWREIIIQGANDNGDDIISIFNALASNISCHPISLYHNFSTATETVLQGGRPVFTRTFLFSLNNGVSVWEEIAWTEHSYQPGGAPRLSSNSRNERTEFLYDPTTSTLNTIKETNGAITNITKYDALGRPNETTLSNVDTPIKTTHVYDPIGRLTKTIIGLNSPEITSSETISNSQTYNPAGLPLVNTKICSATTTYNYEVNDGRIIRTTATYSDLNSNSRQEHFFDGRLKSITGEDNKAASIEEHHSYSLSANGQWTIETQYGSETETTTQKNTYDWLGRIVRSEIPNTHGGTIVTHRTYHYTGTGAGKLSSTYSNNGLPPVRYTYSLAQAGALRREYLDVNQNNIADLEGSDRILEYDHQIVKDAQNHWWAEDTTYTYPYLNDSTRTILQRSRQRLTGFATNQLAESYHWGSIGSTSFPEADPPYHRATRNLTYFDSANDSIVSKTWSPGVQNPSISETNAGFLTQTTAPDNSYVSRFYDHLGRLQSEQPSHAAQTTYNYYSGTTKIFTINGPDQNGNEVTLRTFEYRDQSCGPLTLETDAFGATTRYQYNSRGQVTHIWGSAVQPSQMKYNNLGQRTDLYTYRNFPAEDSASFPSDPDPDPTDRTQWEYHPAAALLTAKIDAAGRRTEYQYDNLNRLTHRILPRTHSNDGHTGRLYRQHSYHPTGELQNLDYRITKGTTAAPTTSDPADGLTGWVNYKYDRLGRLASVADAATPGNGRIYAYNDDHGSLREILFPSHPEGVYHSEAKLTYNFETDTFRPNGLELRLNGNLLYDTDRTYEPATGRLQSSIEKQGGSPHPFTFSHLQPHGDGFQNTITFNGPHTFTRTSTFDARGYLQSIATTQGARNLATYAYTRDAIGRSLSEHQTGTIFERYHPNGLSTSYKAADGTGLYSKRGELLGAKTYLGNGDSGEVVKGRAWAFSFDSANNRQDMSQHDEHQGNYVHNNLNQLTAYSRHSYTTVSGFADADAVYVNNSPASRQGDGDSKSFFYHKTHGSTAPGLSEEEILTVTAGKTDPATGQTHVAQETVTRERPPTAVSIEYDLSGNRIRDSRWSYEYDGENRLIRMTNHPAYSSTQTELRFVYDAEHRRVQKIISENAIPVDVTAFLYDDFQVIATLDSSGNPKQTFHWTHEGPGGLLALTDHRTSPRQTHVAGYDGRGNLTTLLNAADASLSAAYEYAPFGEVIRATGPYAPQNPVGFSTTWTDRTTHLNYYGYRFYHPTEGRFLNQDPIEEQGGKNLYAAFSGDPVNRWDFRGLSAKKHCWEEYYGGEYAGDTFHIRLRCITSDDSFDWAKDPFKFSYGGSSGEDNQERVMRQIIARELNETEYPTRTSDPRDARQTNDQAQGGETPEEREKRRKLCAGYSAAISQLQGQQVDGLKEFDAVQSIIGDLRSEFATDPGWLDAADSFRRDAASELLDFVPGVDFLKTGFDAAIAEDDFTKLGKTTLFGYGAYVGYSELINPLRNSYYGTASISKSGTRLIGKVAFWSAIIGFGIKGYENFAPVCFNKVQQAEIINSFQETGAKIMNNKVLGAWNAEKIFQDLYDKNNCSDFE